MIKYYCLEKHDRTMKNMEKEEFASETKPSEGEENSDGDDQIVCIFLVFIYMHNVVWCIGKFAAIFHHF